MTWTRVQRAIYNWDFAASHECGCDIRYPTDLNTYAECLKHLFTDVEEASLILKKQPLLLLQPLAQRSDLNTVRITEMVFTHKFYHHAALNVGQFKALLGWSISCTSRSFCSIRFREIINSSSLRLSRFWTSCSSVSQSRFCCWIIRSICLISSWSSGSQEERTELETQNKPLTQVKQF